MATFGDMVFQLGGMPVGVNQDISGSTYFVDGNSGSDSNDGKSWKAAFASLKYAALKSHTDIARGSDRWARRNTIYIAGDSFEENLVAFPQKTDIIGVGSYNGYPKPNILGNHVIANAAMGTRFFNVGFEPVTATDIMQVKGDQWGASFIGCTFRALGTLTAISAIQATACNAMQILKCDFRGPFSGDVIDICAGNVNDTRIVGNYIIGGANDGIVLSGVATISDSRRGVIADNYISVVAKTIDTRTVSVFDVINNKLISAQSLGGDSHVIDPTFAVGNLVTGADTSIGSPVWNVA